MRQLVEEAERILTDSSIDLNEFGRILDYTWKLKRQTGKNISTDNIDLLYEKAMKAGASGGKLLGAGGGGFLVFYVEEDKKKRVMEALENLLYIPFRFEDAGTQVIYYVPESYEQEENAKGWEKQPII